jgi:hypothetical protein
MASRLRGTIIKTPDTSPGLLVADGQQKTFTLEGAWKSPVAPAVNMAVDIELDDAGFITGLTAVNPPQLPSEKLEHIGRVVQMNGNDALGKARQGVGALAARMGTLPLVATVNSARVGCPSVMGKQSVPIGESARLFLQATTN